MLKQAQILLLVLRAAVIVPILGATLLVILAITGPFFNQVAVSGPAGVGKGVIQFGVAHLLLTAVGFLGIPATVILALVLGGGGSGSGQKPPRGRL